ncbi:MAG: MipA/OmpV family protein [Sulfurimonas sp.]|nr:MipA/OmpV family protein [Sulfurimonas sp.]
MRFILLIFLAFSQIFANDTKQEVTIGAGPFAQTQPYVNVDAKIIASPVLFFDNELFYIRWSRAGVYFLGDKQDDFSWAFSLTLQPRVYGYESSDILGMDKREETWEGGLALSAKKEDAYIEIMILNDLLNKYNSWILKTEIGYEFELAKFSIYPSFIAVYQTSKFLNYYYGVKK